MEDLSRKVTGHSDDIIENELNGIETEHGTLYKKLLQREEG